MATASIPCSIRHQLLTLARRPRARITAFSRSRPTDWRPGQVRNPAGSFDGCFTEVAAWELIASKLQSGHDIEMIPLTKPAGRTGYVMKIVLEDDAPLLYVKLELGAGKVFGRSFHYSDT